MQFAWFVGHVATILGVLFYALTYIKSGSRFHRFWYILALFGILESFGILVYQLVVKKSLKSIELLRDDNTQYFLLAFAFLLFRPYVLFPLLPFALFSTFHILAYSKGVLFPIFGIGQGLDQKVGDFISSNNSRSIQLASILEIYSFVLLTLRVITFRKNSLFIWLVYGVFLKLRFEKSTFTRNYFKTIELTLDDTVNKTGNPSLKDIWIKVKGVVRNIGSFHLVNDYTKEKLQ